MKKILVFLLFITTKTFAQDIKLSPFTISGYAEGYYNYDFNRPANHSIAPFIYSNNKTNEPNLNLGMVKAAFVTENVRANLAIAAGTYVNANYAAEPNIVRNIYEANLGIKLSNKSNLWLDAGILPSHIGWESAIGKDNWTLSRSLAADNSPYFETGARLSYTTKDEKWYLSALVLNGWQRIRREAGNSTPAFGTQVTYKPNAQITLNSSSFLGYNLPDSVHQMRYFHDLYGVFQLNKRLAATLGFDIGAEQIAKGSSRFNTWYTPVIMMRYTLTPKTSFALRAEYYTDKNGVIINTATPNGFNAWGYSANADYHITKQLLGRMEIRNLNSEDKLYSKMDQGLTNNSTLLSASLAFSF
ncbi:porin [Pedobacter sp. L105]|uniref:porin n=1 Tax=Pedobacter sp. L105 TaxID=1641871 RepID=UPI00131BE14B|nr:porin [Pedobacter sp. L105]